MRPMPALISILAMTLAGCALTTPQSAPESPSQTWLAVHGPRDWFPTEEMSLEIGDAAWAITPAGGGGVVTPDLSQASKVRLVGIGDCRAYASFSVTPGSAWIIRFAADGSVTVEDAAGQAHEMGPGLVERQPSGCESSV